MPSDQSVSTRGHFRARITSKNPKVNGKYLANSGYFFIECRAPATSVRANEFGIGELYDARDGNYRGDPIRAETLNKLYGKLRDEVTGPKGELLTSVVEWKTSLDMISGRGLQILAAFQAVRKLKFGKAAKILNIATPSKVKNLTKRKHIKAQGLSVTSIWLEYWMGWAPLYGDIAHAVTTLTKESKPEIRHFSVSVPQETIKKERTYRVIDSSMVGAYFLDEFIVVKKQRFAAYGDMVVTNHNAHIADQLGFTNPALTLWQTLPFSFMIDWFANIGTILGSLTDFLGVSFSNTGQASKTVVASEREIVEYGVLVKEYWADYYWAYRKELVLRTGLKAKLNLVSFERSPGSLPTPRLNVRMLDKLSLTRAATTISLLNEIFLRK